MTSDEIAVLFINLEDDVIITDDDGKINLCTVIGEFADWLRTNGECKNFGICYRKWKNRLDGLNEKS